MSSSFSHTFLSSPPALHRELLSKTTLFIILWCEPPCCCSELASVAKFPPSPLCCLLLFPQPFLAEVHALASFCSDFSYPALSQIWTLKAFMLMQLQADWETGYFWKCVCAVAKFDCGADCRGQDEVCLLNELKTACAMLWEEHMWRCLSNVSSLGVCKERSQRTNVSARWCLWLDNVTFPALFVCSKINHWLYGIVFKLHSTFSVASSASWTNTICHVSEGRRRESAGAPGAMSRWSQEPNEVTLG